LIFAINVLKLYKINEESFLKAAALPSRAIRARAIQYAPLLPTVVIAIELFSELYFRFMTLFKAHESTAAEHTRATTMTTTTTPGTLYPRRDAAIRILGY